MNIGLIDIEPKIFNTALMQIAYYHKDKGDTVEWAAPLEYDRFDKLYCSSLFDYTDKSQIPDRAICGGTGFDLTTKLPFDCDYDYSIYPECDFSIVWFSRGCIRNCKFCVVRQKEGKIRKVKPKPLNPKGRYIVVQDNNFFANPSWIFGIMQLKNWGLSVDFQGIDVRTLSKQKCQILDTLKHYKQIKIAWDNPPILKKKEDEREGEKKAVPEMLIHLRRITRYIKPYKIMCYVLIGFNSTLEQDLYRVETLRDMKIDPFVMPFNKKDTHQKRFARWVNHKAIFYSVKWEDYRP